MGNDRFVKITFQKSLCQKLLGQKQLRQKPKADPKNSG
jgi:hypothetical protein